MIWYIPTWSGDFRLSPDGVEPKHSVLSISTPTAGERKKLDAFLAAACARDWVEPGWDYERKGETSLPVRAPVAEAGALLAGTMIEGVVWTAVRSIAGVVTVETGKISEAALVKADAKAAASVSPPTRGCPAPEPCNRRASEVLRAFSTTTQWQDWQFGGWMRVVGNVTGKSYRLWHRDAAAQRGLSHVLEECGTGDTICVYDPLRPSEEEALSIKLAIEHHEGWLVG